jgi:DHA1 family inner membrane transport protein
MPFALYPLILAAFAIGTTEFVIMGLLPDVAADLAVTIPQAGLLVSSYAMGVVVGGPILAVATSGLPERRTLLGLFGLFITGNLLCALAPGYGMLMGARVVTAFAHGTFLGVGAVVAMSLVPARRRTEAVGYLFSGITSANVIGVPAGIALGHALGWRWTFGAVAALAIVAAVLLALSLPAAAAARRPQSVLEEIKGLRGAPFWTAVALTVACSATLLCLFTFITPFLLQVTGVSPPQVTQVLLLYGIGLTLGTIGGGRLAARSLLRPIVWGLALAMAILLAMPYLGQHLGPCAVGLFFWGMLSFGLCPILQTLVMSHAPAAPTLASTLNHSAFNLGNALGAWVGSLALSHGQPLAYLPWTCVGLSCIALALAALHAKVSPQGAQPLPPIADAHGFAVEPSGPVAPLAKGVPAE